MNFIQNILDRLDRSREAPLLQEIRDGSVTTATGGDLLAAIDAARAFLSRRGLRKGDRCALLAPNSIRWAALDMAMMAEGLIAVPLYTRQAPGELVAMMKDCAASMVCCGDESLRETIGRHWPAAPSLHLLDEVLASAGSPSGPGSAKVAVGDDDPVTLIYTSGTSGEPKGVVLSARNVNHMLSCTGARLDLLMGSAREPDRVFHYLPFCFAGSWIMLLTCLSRNSILCLSTDLTRLAEDIRQAAPHYFLNVPALLERMRAGIEDELERRGRLVSTIYRKAREAGFRRRTAPGSSPVNGSGTMEALWLSLAEHLVFPAIRAHLSPRLKALICGSAPLNEETQVFFNMIGVPVLQVYGLTETTAICTMDDPRCVVPGRVGPAIPRIEMKLGAGNEILVKGANVFSGYWNRPEATAEVMEDGWFHTGDQGHVDETGNWAIVGRMKNLIILSSGHNVAPEAIEEKLRQSLPGVHQVVLMGQGRSFLTAIITGDVTRSRVEAGIEQVNAELPHYQRIRGFHIGHSPLTVESGLLTANGKLKREAIAAHFAAAVEDLYRVRTA